MKERRSRKSMKVRNYFQGLGEATLYGVVVVGGTVYITVALVWACFQCI